jgi:hypothetical protein
MRRSGTRSWSNRSTRHRIANAAPPIAIDKLAWLTLGVDHSCAADAIANTVRKPRVDDPDHRQIAARDQPVDVQQVEARQRDEQQTGSAIENTSAAPQPPQRRRTTAARPASSAGEPTKPTNPRAGAGRAFLRVLCTSRAPSTAMATQA